MAYHETIMAKIHLEFFCLSSIICFNPHGKKIELCDAESLPMFIYATLATHTSHSVRLITLDVKIFPVCVCTCTPPEYSHLLSLSQPLDLYTFPAWLIRDPPPRLLSPLPRLSSSPLFLLCYRYSLPPSVSRYPHVPTHTTQHTLSTHTHTRHPQWPCLWPLTSGVNVRSHLTRK